MGSIGSTSLFGNLGDSKVKTNEAGTITVSSDLTSQMTEGLEKVRDIKTQKVQDKIDTLTQQKAALTELETHLTTLHTASKSFQKFHNFLGKSVLDEVNPTGYGTRTDSQVPSGVGDVVDGNITSDAPVKSLTLEVKKLATYHQVTGGAVSSTTDDLQTLDPAITDPFDLELNGTTIQILPTDTLETLQTKINASQKETGVTAFVQSVGGSHQLMFQGVDTGQVIVSKITGINPVPSFMPEQNNESLTAADAGLLAEYTFNGVDGTSATNTITPVAGVSLTFKKAEVGTTFNISIEPNVPEIVTKLSEFKDSYNALNTFLRNQMNSEAESGNELNKERLIDDLQYDLAILLQGFKITPDENAFTSLEAIGITIQSGTGEMNFDIDKAAEVIRADFKKFQDLLDFSYTSTESRISMVEHPVHIPRAMLVDGNNDPVTTTVTISRSGEDYTATVAYGTESYDIPLDEEQSSSSGFLYFKAKTGELTGFEFALKNDPEITDGGSLATSMTFDEGLFEKLNTTLDNVTDPTAGEIFHLREKFDAAQGVQEEKIEYIKGLYDKKIQRLQHKLTKLEETMNYLEQSSKTVDAFLNAGKDR